MSTAVDFSYLTENIQYVKLLGQEWLVALCLTLLITIFLTRNMKNVGKILLPVYVSLLCVGLNVGYIGIPLGTLFLVFFMVDIIGADKIPSMMRSALPEQRREKEIRTWGKNLAYKTYKQKRYMQPFKDQMDLIKNQEYISKIPTGKFDTYGKGYMANKYGIYHNLPQPTEQELIQEQISLNLVKKKNPWLFANGKYIKDKKQSEELKEQYIKKLIG